MRLRPLRLLLLGGRPVSAVGVLVHPPGAAVIKLRSGAVMVGRREVADGLRRADRWLYDLAHQRVQEAEPLFKAAWPTSELWASWNVIGLSSRPTDPSDPVRLLTFEGFAEQPFPELKSAIRYVPSLGMVDPAPVGGTKSDPVLLHGSVALFGPGEVQGDHNRGQRAGFTERLRTLSQQLDRSGLLAHPLAGTRLGFARLLEQRGLQIDDDLRLCPKKRARSSPHRPAALG